MDAADRWLSKYYEGTAPRYSATPALRQFWKDFTAARTAKGRMNILRRMANLVLPHPKAYGVRRLKFNKSKRKCGLRIGVQPCAVCETARATQRHHVILLRNGGPNQRRNLIPICLGCHAAIHPWMH